MAAVKKGMGLGRGLNALIPQSEPITIENSSVTEIKITEIEPNNNQPRSYFEDSSLADLANSIKEHGIVQPLILKKLDFGYKIVAGERRWRAARLAGLKHVPAIIKNYSEQQVLEVALVENIQRQDLNPIEEALAYQMLMNEYHMTQEEISVKVSKSRSAVANSLRLVILPKNIHQMIITGKISAGHARALLSLSHEEEQIELANKIVEQQLSVRQVEALVKKYQESKKEMKGKKNTPKDFAITEVEERIMHVFASKVKVTTKKEGGKIEIEYYNNDHLDKILDILET